MKRIFVFVFAILIAVLSVISLSACNEIDCLKSNHSFSAGKCSYRLLFNS